MGEENLDCPINVFDSESMEVEERNSRTARPDDGGETEERIIYGVEDAPLPHLTVVFALQVRYFINVRCILTALVSLFF